MKKLKQGELIVENISNNICIFLEHKNSFIYLKDNRELLRDNCNLFVCGRIVLYFFDEISILEK